MGKGGHQQARARAERLAGQAAFEGITSAQLEAFNLAEWDSLARRCGIMVLPGRTDRTMAVAIVVAVEEAERLLHEPRQLPGTGEK